MAAVIVVGDVSLLMLFFTRKLLGQSTNILVFSVAVADLMAGLLVLPLDVMQVMNGMGGGGGGGGGVGGGGGGVGGV